MSRFLDRDAALGLGLIAGLLTILVLGLSGTLTRLFSSDPTRQVSAVFADVQQLRAGDGVRMQGVEVGKVKRVALAADGRTATVTMDVDREAGQVYADARAVLRWKNVLGGSFYVDVERGSAGRPPLSGPIPVARTARQVELDDVVTTVQGGARTGLQTLPGQMAQALADPEAPAAVLDAAADASPSLQGGLRALRGQDLDRDLTGVVRDAARTVHALDQPADDVRRIVSGAGAVLQTTAARDADLRSALQLAPGSLDETQLTLTRLRTTLGLADPLLAKLRDPVKDVAPTLRELRPAVLDASALVHRARPLVSALRPTLRSLAGTGRRGVPFLKAIDPSVRRLDDTILPSLNEVEPDTQKRLSVMIGGTFTGLASGAGGQIDQIGRFIRFPATSGSSPVNSLPCQVYINNPDAAQIAACNKLDDALGTFLNYNPVGSTPGTEPPSGGGGG